MRILQSVVALFAAATLQAATLESTISFVDGRELFEKLVSWRFVAFANMFFVEVNFEVNFVD